MSTKFKPIEYRGHNNYDTAAASAAAVTEMDPVSLTLQSQAEDADINVLMKRYGITGKMPENPRIPTYGDFTNITDYRSAVEAVRNAHEGFMEFPAELRARYDNDPQKFMDYCHEMDPTTGQLKHLEELRKFGIAKPAPAPFVPSPETQAIVDAVKSTKPETPAQ